jgi:hypothetical protein
MLVLRAINVHIGASFCTVLEIQTLIFNFNHLNEMLSALMHFTLQHSAPVPS